MSQQTWTCEPLHMTRNWMRCVWFCDGKDAFVEDTHTPRSPFNPMSVHYVFSWSNMKSSDWIQAGGLKKNIIKDWYPSEDGDTWYRTTDFDHACAVYQKLMEKEHEHQQAT